MLQNITVNGESAEAFEDFTDQNNNGEWDDGEEFVDSRELKISISNELQTTYLDYDLRTATIYNYNISS